MVWKDCGYLSLSKDGKKVSVVVKKARYIANLEELRKVLDGKKSYTFILEPIPTKEETT
ncbi:MAG: hypothetical protein ABSB28_11790 [Candidatus Bathyarchaeia archaeon]